MRNAENATSYIEKSRQDKLESTRKYFEERQKDEFEWHTIASENEMHHAVDIRVSKLEEKREEEEEKILRKYEQAMEALHARWNDLSKKEIESKLAFAEEKLTIVNQMFKEQEIRNESLFKLKENFEQEHEKIHAEELELHSQRMREATTSIVKRNKKEKKEVQNTIEQYHDKTMDILEKHNDPMMEVVDFDDSSVGGQYNGRNNQVSISKEEVDHALETGETNRVEVIVEHEQNHKTCPFPQYQTSANIEKTMGSVEEALTQHLAKENIEGTIDQKNDAYTTEQKIFIPLLKQSEYWDNIVHSYKEGKNIDCHNYCMFALVDAKFHGVVGEKVHILHDDWEQSQEATAVEVPNTKSNVIDFAAYAKAAQEAA